MARVFISDAAIFQTTRNPKGSAGTARWMDRLALSTIAIAEKDAPVNNPLNALHREAPVGVYKASFTWDRKGGTVAYLKRSVWNTARHAGIVEFGRRSSRGRSVEVFTWNRFVPPGSLGALYGTGGRSGYGILRLAQQKAWAAARYGYKVEATYRPRRGRF